MSKSFLDAHINIFMNELSDIERDIQVINALETKSNIYTSRMDKIFSDFAPYEASSYSYDLGNDSYLNVSKYCLDNLADSVCSGLYVDSSGTITYTTLLLNVIEHMAEHDLQSTLNRFINIIIESSNFKAADANNFCKSFVEKLMFSKMSSESIKTCFSVLFTEHDFSFSDMFDSAKFICLNHSQKDDVLSIMCEHLERSRLYDEYSEYTYNESIDNYSSLSYIGLLMLQSPRHIQSKYISEVLCNIDFYEQEIHSAQNMQVYKNMVLLLKNVGSLYFGNIQFGNLLAQANILNSVNDYYFWESHVSDNYQVESVALPTL